MMQPSLLELLNTSRESKRRDIDEKFAAFHARNPQVYDTLVAMAREAVARGQRHVGIAMLWEIIRWNETVVNAAPSSEFLLDNDLRSRYARAIMESEPDLAGVFKTRRLRDVAA